MERSADVWRAYWDKRGGLWSWLLPLIVYLSIVTPLAIQHKERLNSDAVSYIGRAQSLTQGEFGKSVSSYWSPLISWSAAPLMLAKVDGLYAIRAALCVWGGVFVVVFVWFLRRVAGLGEGWRMAAGLAAAVGAAPVAVKQITPDLILATCLLAYFTLAGGDLLRSRGRQFVCGLAGGVAYLAKAYALPVVIVHLPLTYAMRWMAGRKSREIDAPVPGMGAALRGWAISLAGLALVAGPWIGLISRSEGKFTFSTSAARAHAYVGPRASDVRGGALPAAGTQFSETDDRGTWSPFESRAAMMRQLRVIRDHAQLACLYIAAFDRLHLVLVALWLVPAVVLGGAVKNSRPAIRRPGGVLVLIIHLALTWFVWRAISPALGVEAGIVAGALGALGALFALGVLSIGDDRRTALYIGLTAAVYLSGFLMVWFRIRYIVSVIAPLGLAMAMLLIVRSGAARAIVARILAAAIVLGSSILGGSILYKGGESLTSAMADIAYLNSPRQQPSRLYRDVANKLRKHKLTGQFACSDRLTGVFVSLLSGQSCARWPAGNTPGEVEDALRKMEVKVLLIYTPHLRIKADLRAATQPATTRFALPTSAASADDDAADDESAAEASKRNKRFIAQLAKEMVKRPGWKQVLMHRDKHKNGMVRVYVPPWGAP